MKTIKSKICRQCWKSFVPTNSLSNCCSFKCYDKYKLNKEKTKKAQKRDAKKISVSVLSKKADKLWSEVIRSVWKCEHCWKTEFLNAHHIIWRNARSTRWEISNWICLCSWCHTFSSEFSAHKNPLLFHKWLEQYKWTEYIDKLMELSNIPLKVTSERLQERIKYFEEKIKYENL